MARLLIASKLEKEIYVILFDVNKWKKKKKIHNLLEFAETILPKSCEKRLTKQSLMALIIQFLEINLSYVTLHFANNQSNKPFVPSSFTTGYLSTINSQEASMQARKLSKCFCVSSDIGLAKFTRLVSANAVNQTHATSSLSFVRLRRNRLIHGTTTRRLRVALPMTDIKAFV